MFKCELLIGGQTYDVTNDLKNWDDFELLQKRPAYDGVVRSFSTQFEFVKKAYKLLKNEFYTNYLSAEGTVIFSLRNNNWEYDEVFRCALDFSTYSEDGLIAYINAIDNTLAAIIKAKKNIQYEYPVADIDVRSLKYDRLKMQSEYQYVPYQTDNEKENQGEYDFDEVGEFPAMMRSSLTFPLLYTTAETTKEADKIVDVKNIYNLYPDKENVYSRDYIFRNVSKYEDIKIEVSYDFVVTSLNGSRFSMHLLVWRPGQDDRPERVDYVPIIHLPLSTGHVKGTRTLSVPHGCNFVCCFLKESVIDELKVRISDFKKFSISFDTVGEPVDINVISPNTILSKLLSSMTENTIEYQGSIDYFLPSSAGIKFNRLLERTYIMAAESARGLPKAKIYTSYKKFCDWMEAEFGYVPVISGNEVTFTHRDDLFTNIVVKELGKKINDYELTVNDSLIYSSVKVGYDKQDYDSINGRDEFRFTNEFSTGLKLLDNTLSLISPYRADAYGIEFLVQKRGEDTTDNSSDNDVFFVDCVKNPSTGTLDLHRPYSSAQISGLLSPETMFNLGYSPRFMLEANKKYIGACTNLLKFASSDGNSDVSINGSKETDDFPISERLFTVSEVEVSTSDIKAPSDLTGLVSFNNKGEIITGYIKQLELNIAKEKAATYTLIVKDIKK
ncbi:hypothetical protein [Bacteroides acidifaciens]|uniref:hypothetical protein n=1 Tax=Bacteroides acidifaciens TaxID=85831 RepID=UPI0025582F80|nr:hypothetical protein [Bacteroides acidifaciens]